MEAQDRTEDGTKPALRVTSLFEVEAFKRRCSDQLKNLPRVDEVTDDLYNICDVLPQDPTDDQLGDLAVRFSSFLEDVWRANIDWRGGPLGMLSLPMSLPIAHRGRMKEQLAVLKDASQFLSGELPPAWPTERETICMLYLNVSRWSASSMILLSRDAQRYDLDQLARRHGLRCVEIGVIPQD